MQQQTRAKQQAEAQQRRQQQLEQAPKPEEDTWPPRVQEAYYALSIARSSELPVASRRLAQLGLPAAAALRKIASTPRHSPEKRAAASLLLVELQMFRSAELAKLAQQSELPILQRGAIEALARLGSKEARQALGELRQQLVIGSGAEGGLSAEQKLQQGDLSGFIDQALQRPRWGYSTEQLGALDRLLQASTEAEVDAALTWVKDLTLLQGLLQLLRSAVMRPPVQEAVARKVVSLTAPKQLQQLTQPQMPPAVRLAATEQLLQAGSAHDRAYLLRLSQNKQDPFAPFLQQLLRGASD